MKYDLVLTGGTVMDPAQIIHARLDLAVTKGKIAKLAPSISSSEAVKVVDVTGKIVTPGLIDLHTHVFHTGHNVNHPDNAGVYAGITTVVDAGGPGTGDFQDFCDWVLPRAKTSVYPFINIYSDSHLNEMDPSKWTADIEGSIPIAKENPDLVKGVKVTFSPRMVTIWGRRFLEDAKQVAREAGVPILMHIGDTGPKTMAPTPPEMTKWGLSMMDPGDIITHMFTPLNGGALDSDGKVWPELKEAKERGVILDPGYGSFNFSWEVVDAVLSQGITPDTISSDLEIQPGFGFGIHQQVGHRGLIEFASYFLAMGFSLDDVIRMTTTTPAKAIGIEDSAGSLAVSREADISILEVSDSEYELADVLGNKRIGSKAIAPVFTVKGGEVLELGEPPYPWGWTPPAVEPLPSSA